MKKLIISLSFLIVYFAKAQSITFIINSPTSNSVTDSMMNAEVYVIASTYDISSVTATILNHTYPLEMPQDYPNHFLGYLNLSGLPKGIPLWMKVTVKDVLGYQKTDSVQITYVPPPTIIFEYPVQSNIYPSLHIKTAFSGIDTCHINVTAQIGGQQIFEAHTTTNIDTTIFVSNSLLGGGSLTATITDRWGQAGSGGVDIYADHEPYIIPIYTGVGNILDYRYHRVLESDNTKTYLTDSNLQNRLPIPGISGSGTGQVTPYGAIVESNEWTNGILYHISPTSKSTAGKWLTYTTQWFAPAEYGQNLYLLNMETRATELITDGSHSSGLQHCANDNGAVFYTDGEYIPLQKYQDKQNTLVPTGNQYPPNSPVSSDGVNVIYWLINSDLYPNDDMLICYNDGTTQSILSNLGSYSLGQFNITVPENYTMAGKFCAYSKLGGLGQFQIWIRDSSGNNTQATFFGNNSLIEGISPAGDLIFKRDDNGIYKRYYLKYGNTIPKELGLINGRVIYRDSGWYIISGNILSRLNVGASCTIANGNWSNAATWENGQVPPSGADVIVTNNIVIDHDVTCNSLKVIPPASVTVLPGVHVTILQ